MQRFLLYIAVVFFSNYGFAQTDSIVSQLPRPNVGWEAGYQQRLNLMWGNRIPAYSINPNNGNQDAGKWEWPKLLAKMAWPATNYSSSTMLNFIQTGRNMVNGSNVGSFYSPFSCAGYAMYYFRWKNEITANDPTQVGLIYSDVKNMWHQLMKADHVFDPCCGYNTYGGKEFNSENFHWMMRAAGYLFAHELHNKSINGVTVDMTNLNLSSNGITLHTGLNSPRTKTIYPNNVNAIAYFDGFLKNLTRTLYNAGRVEWNSNNYFGHTFNPLLTIYEGADKCNDPNGAENKKRAQACLDWMMLEAAIHFVDGAQVAADSRAKTGSFRPFTGSYYQYTIPYFTDTNFKLSCSDAYLATKDPTEMEIGFQLSSSYRPPQIMIDIAQRNFSLPVEIQSAKPFYHIDQGRYFNTDGTINGEFPYNAWNGTGKGRKFEFETIWIDKNLTMASAAVGRPDGSKGTYSEQCMWRIGVKGQQAGARILSGNAGTQTTTAGRSPQHEIGQFRNMMMQMIKHSSAVSNKIWFVVPDSLKQLQTTGEANFWDVQKYKWIDNNLYLQLRPDVFLAVKPYPQPVEITKGTSGEAATHSLLTFRWDANQLGCLLFELATDKDYNSFDDFVAAVQSKNITEINSNTLSYTSANNNTIKMEYVDPGSFEMTPYTYDTPSPNPFSPAGSYPKVWGNGEYIDYQTWDSYKTVYGQNIVNQAWGSGVLELNASGNKARITVDPSSADVKYEIEKKNPTTMVQKNESGKTINIYPNPFTTDFRVENLQPDAIVQLFNACGKQMHVDVIGDIVHPAAALNAGIYFLKIMCNLNMETYKLVKL